MHFVINIVIIFAFKNSSSIIIHHQSSIIIKASSSSTTINPRNNEILKITFHIRNRQTTTTSHPS